MLYYSAGDTVCNVYEEYGAALARCSIDVILNANNFTGYICTQCYNVEWIQVEVFNTILMYQYNSIS